MIQVAPGIHLVECAVYIPQYSVLCVADLHIGLEHSIAGNQLSLGHQHDMLVRIESLFKNTGARQLIVNGDIKHEFGSPNAEERQGIRSLVELCFRYKAQLHLIAGNHDVGLTTFLRHIDIPMQIPVYDILEWDDLCFVHGDGVFSSHKSVTIMGHHHPAIVLSDGIRKEQYPCFVVAKTGKTGIVIVVPAFHRLSRGTPIDQGVGASGVLKDIPDTEWNIYVVDDMGTTYYFGQYGALKGEQI